MAAGQTSREYNQVVPNTPILSAVFNGEIAKLIAAHNDLYDDWEPDLTTLRAMLIDNGVDPDGMTIGGGVTAGSLNIGLDPSPLAVEGGTFGDAVTHYVEDTLLTINGTKHLNNGTIMPRGTQLHVTSWSTGQHRYTDCVLGDNLYDVIVVSATTTNPTTHINIRMPDTIDDDGVYHGTSSGEGYLYDLSTMQTAGNGAFGIPQGHVMTWVNDFDIYDILIHDSDGVTDVATIGPGEAQQIVALSGGRYLKIS